MLPHLWVSGEEGDGHGQVGAHVVPGPGGQPRFISLFLCVFMLVFSMVQHDWTRYGMVRYGTI